MKIEMATLSTLLVSVYAQIAVPVPGGIVPPGVTVPPVPQAAIPPVSVPQNKPQAGQAQPAQGSPEWFRVAMANSPQPSSTSQVPTSSSTPNDGSPSRSFVLLSIFSAVIPVLFL